MVESILSYEFSGDDDYYGILGCDETSSFEQINTEFKLRALQAHPDKNLDDELSVETFKKLQQAKEVLTDPAKRADYDKWRRSGVTVSYRQWLGLGEVVKTTMHWASKPQTAPMIGPGEDERNVATEEKSNSPLGSSKGVNTSASYVIGNIVWQRDEGSELLRKFRNYEI